MSRPGERRLATVLFTDIVGSTEIAADLGDVRWRDMLLRHNALVRRELKRWQGHEVDTAGDGFFAIFGAPAGAVRCACAISEVVRELGIEIRAGLHYGEIEEMRPKVAGIAVNTASRIAALAGPGEVLVSSTVEELVAGSGIEFVDLGERALKGIPGEKRLFEVSALDGASKTAPLDPSTAEARRSAFRSPTNGAPVRRAVLAVCLAFLAAVLLGLVYVAVQPDDRGAPSATGRPAASSSTSRALLTPAQNELLTHIPGDVREGCGPSDVSVEQIAAVTCESGDVHVRYSSYASVGSMNSAFQSLVGALGISVGDCRVDRSATSRYRVNGSIRGKVACDQRDGRSTIAWTDDRLLVRADAARDDLGDVDLFGWWMTHADPAGEPISTSPHEGTGWSTVLPSGTYSMTVTPRQAERSDLVTGAAGGYTLDFGTRGFSITHEGNLDLPQGGSSDIPTKYVFTKSNEVAFYPVGGGSFGKDPGLEGCATVLYRWRVRGGQLLLTPTRDRCYDYPDRAQTAWLLSLNPWTPT